MLVHIHDNLKVSDVQERFSKCFPFLKIEFYNKFHYPSQPSDEKNKIDSAKRIGEIRKNHTSGILDVKSWDKVEKVEHNFKEKFGLNVQVFRKDLNGNGWIQTSRTDKFTLLQQAEWSVMPMPAFLQSSKNNQ